MGKVMEATTSFACELDGNKIMVNERFTRVDSGHELVTRFPQHFRPVEDGLTYPVESATSNPGEVRERPSAVPTRHESASEPQSTPKAASEPENPAEKPSGASEKPPAARTKSSTPKPK